MNLDKQLRTAFQEETKEWVAPPELKIRILKQVTPTYGGRKVKRWLIASIVAASLLVPTGVYAGYHYLADTLYGSQENVMQIGGTQQEYERLEAKLQAAEQSFSKNEFAVLMSLLKNLGSYNLKMADSKGVLHPEQLSASDQVAYAKLTAELEPYFAKLQGVGAPKDEAKVLDSEAFWEEQIKKAELEFNKEELGQFTTIVNKIRAYDTKTVGSNGATHSNQLSEADKDNVKRLFEQLKPYSDRLGFWTKEAK